MTLFGLGAIFMANFLRKQRTLLLKYSRTAFLIYVVFVYIAECLVFYRHFSGLLKLRLFFFQQLFNCTADNNNFCLICKLI